MITLRQKLYESLLDDEEDLIENDAILKKDIFDNVYGKFTKPFQIDQYVDMDKGKPDLKVAFFPDTDMDGFTWALSGDHITDYYFIYIISNTHVFKTINHKKINIDILGQLMTDEDFLKNMDKYLQVKQLNMLNLQLWDGKTNWADSLNGIKLDTVAIAGGSLESNARDLNSVNLIHSIKGLNIDTLILSCRLFLDITQYYNHIEYEQTYRNTPLLDYIFENNKFKKLLIMNEQGYKRKYIEVRKSNREESGYKFVRSKWELTSTLTNKR